MHFFLWFVIVATTCLSFFLLYQIFHKTNSLWIPTIEGQQELMDSVRATDDNDSSGSNWHYLYTKTYIPWRSRETSVRFLSEIPSIRSICWFRIAREFIDSDFWSSRFSSLLLFFLDRAAFPHSTRPALFTNLYNQCHKDSKLDYRIYKERGDGLAPDIRGCGKSSCEKRKNHQKTTIAREGFHRKTPWFWQTDHNYRYLGAYRWNEQNTNS